MLHHTQPVKPKIIPVTIVTVAPIVKTESKPPEPVKQKVSQPHKTLTPTPKPLAPKPIVEKPAPEPKPVPVQKPVVQPIPTPPKAPTPPPAPSPAMVANVKNKYLSKIRQSIDKLKSYPKNAKRLGQTGTVKVTFTVMADGTIEKTSVEQTSGFTSLDEAAMKILTTLAKVPPIPKELAQESFEITLPIDYTIN